MKDASLRSKMGGLIRSFIKTKNNVVSKSERKDLLDEIREVSEELEVLKNNYQFVSEEMIDYYTYQIKAAEIKYRYLLKKIRKYDAI